MKKGVFLATFTILLFPIVVFAEASFTEVMYDLEGADAGREWVEVCNSGGDSVDMTGWKFSEGGVNHGLIEAQGGAVLNPGACAIIADNSTAFLSEHSGFSGLVFDSSFSLLNTTETLILRNAELVDVDTMIYISDMGAAGDGNSLQNDNGVWSARVPTPGEAVLGTAGNTDPVNEEDDTVGETEDEASSFNEDANTEAESTGTQSSFPVTPQIFADAGPNYSGVAGGPILFKGQAVGKKNEPLANARYVWTFGDGATREGREVYHTYMHPGRYRVVLNVSSGFNSGTDMTIADVSTATVLISKVATGASGFIEIKNASQKELDVSGWVLSGNGREFVIPQATFILGQEAVVFSAQTTGISVGQGDNIILVYPNRTEAVKYTWTNTKTASLVPVPPKTAAQTMEAPKTQVSKVATQETSPETEESMTLENVEEEQMADIASSAGDKETNSLYPWLLGLMLVAGTGVLSIFLIKPVAATAEQNPFAREAEEYEIEEVK